MESYRVLVLLNSKKEVEIDFTNSNVGSREFEEIIMETDDAEKSESMPAMIFRPMKINLQVTDFKTLLLHFDEQQNSEGPNTIITHKMSFDYVSFAYESFLNTELSTLLDEMFLLRRSCCLMRYTPRRQLHLRFVHELIASIDQRVEDLQYKIESIGVSYRNIGNKYTKNMLAIDLEKTNAEFQAQNTANAEKGIKLHNTDELRLWLLHDFCKMWTEAGGHDALVFNFLLERPEQNTFTVKLMLLNVHFSKIDEDGLSKWHQYINHFGEREKESAFFYSPLTSWMSKFLETEAILKGRTLLLFDVPTQPDLASVTVDMLQMAHAIIKNRSSSTCYERRRSQILVRKHFYTLTAGFPKVVYFQRNFSNSLDSPTTGTTPKSGGVKFTVSLNDDPGTPKNSDVSADFISSKDYNSLSSWYRKIDESYKSVLEAMKPYFEKLSDMKYIKVAESLMEFPDTTTTDLSKKTTSSPVERVINDDAPLNLKSVFSVYYSSCDDFKSLEAQIGSEKAYVDTLKPYYDTKEFELSQLLIKYKMNQLERCQNAVTELISEALSDLQKKVVENTVTDTNNN